ncbi:MAG: tyrosine-type recombinase/integrase [Pseudomonadota bacterium]
MFTTGGGNKRPYTRSGASTFFARVAEEAGLEDFHFHDLRHSSATEVRRSGAGLDVAQALLGHASPAMTQRYAHLGRTEHHVAVARVASLGPALEKGVQKLVVGGVAPHPPAKKPKRAERDKKATPARLSALSAVQVRPSALSIQPDPFVS